MASDGGSAGVAPQIHLSVGELEERYRACEDARTARHFQTIWLLAQRHTTIDASGLTTLAPRWIEQLLARCNLLGETAPAFAGKTRSRPSTG